MFHRTLSVMLAALAVQCLAFADEASQPLIVAHRGLMQDAPENTLSNFRACLNLRIGFEFDVQRTADEHLICIHDSTVDRTTNGKGAVAAMQFAEIRKLDAGSWFHPSFSSERVPTVEEVLSLIAATPSAEALVAVDLKADNVAADVVRLAEKSAVLDRLLFIGTTISQPEVRQQLKSASPKAQTAVVANNTGEFSRSLASPADWVYVRYLPSREQVEETHRAGRKIFIAGSTVSGQMPDNWRHAAQVGIDAILTDYPLPLGSLLRTPPDTTR